MTGPVSDSSMPLLDADREDLVTDRITTHGQLREAEQKAILAARRWALARRRPVERVISEEFLLDLHFRMFARIWQSAGMLRGDDESHESLADNTVRAHLHDALTDASTWITEQTWPKRRIAARYHHRLARIQPFAHGNGRWSRLATDVLVYALHEPVPTWGTGTLDATLRERYIDALKRADGGDVEPLRKLMWS